MVKHWVELSHRGKSPSLIKKYLRLPSLLSGIDYLPVSNRKYQGQRLLTAKKSLVRRSSTSIFARHFPVEGH
jgi:hypothetical protein